MSSRFSSLEEVIGNGIFPAVDLALRRGRHIDREDGEWYAFMFDAQDHLERFYRRYGCELVSRSDGYFYLLPTGDQLSRRHLSAGEMLLGQTMALQYLDPSTLQTSGIIQRDQLLTRLAGLLGERDLARALEPRRRRFTDERIVHEIIRKRVADALRRLASLGFVEIIDPDRLRLRSPLLRFADPVRGLQESGVALERLILSGEVVKTGTTDGSAGSEEEFDSRSYGDGFADEEEGDENGSDVEDLP